MMLQPKTWLVTGCAGFIGSHLIETLLKLNQKVMGLDNFATGHRENLTLVRKAVGERAWKHFRFIQGDIRNLRDCYKAFNLKMSKKDSGRRAIGGGLEVPANHPRRPARFVDIVLHQAALGSVPRSIKNPLMTHEVNVTGFVNMLVAARDAGVRRFVYASSSSVYGDRKELPKREERIGKQLSPYAVSKYANELYAQVFARCYGLETIGLRYFNVFGPRQDPDGPYAAVIPRWLHAIQKGETVLIYGDGKTSRDFCYVDNAVQANILAGAAKNKKALNQIYNVACGTRTSLTELSCLISSALQPRVNGKYAVARGKSARRDHPRSAVHGSTQNPPALRYLPERKGDIRHSLASLRKIKKLQKFRPTVKIWEGINKVTRAFFEQR